MKIKLFVNGKEKKEIKKKIKLEIKRIDLASAAPQGTVNNYEECRYS